ncbi:MAG TPA: chemotaxis protein CheB [Thermoanaerobaculia bacterium]|nr:chemotaxis protein CheB [Thermoanaerobaculia bacterium]
MLFWDCGGGRRPRAFDPVIASDCEGKALSLKEVAVLPLTSARPRNVVGLAASAGGLAALTNVLSALPADFAAPVLIVQHVDPHHRSWLPEILGRHAALEVCQARGGELPAPGATLPAEALPAEPVPGQGARGAGGGGASPGRLRRRTAIRERSPTIWELQERRNPATAAARTASPRA